MEDRPWLTLAEAAKATGLSATALKRRAERGTLDGKKNNKGRWLVQVTPELVPTRSGTSAAPVLAEAHAAEIARLTEAHAAEVARLVGERDAAQAEAKAAQQQLIDHLSRPWWRKIVG